MLHYFNTAIHLLFQAALFNDALFSCCTGQGFQPSQIFRDCPNIKYSLLWLTKSVRFSEKSSISRIWLRQGPKFHKPRLGLFCQINYFLELFSGYPSYPIQKCYIWTSFQTSRKRFRKLQEAIWLTIINEIFKFPPNFDPFGYVNYLYELFLCYSKMIHLS